MVQRQALLEELGTGKTLNPQSAEATLAATAKTVGQIEGLDWLLNFSYDEDEGEYNENE